METSGPKDWWKSEADQKAKEVKQEDASIMGMGFCSIRKRSRRECGQIPISVW